MPYWCTEPWRVTFLEKLIMVNVRDITLNEMMIQIKKGMDVRPETLMITFSPAINQMKFEQADVNFA